MYWNNNTHQAGSRLDCPPLLFWWKVTDERDLSDNSVSCDTCGSEVETGAAAVVEVVAGVLTEAAAAGESDSTEAAGGGTGLPAWALSKGDPAEGPSWPDKEDIFQARITDRV